MTKANTINVFGITIILYFPILTKKGNINTNEGILIGNTLLPGLPNFENKLLKVFECSLIYITNEIRQCLVSKTCRRICYRKNRQLGSSQCIHEHETIQDIQGSYRSPE